MQRYLQCKSKDTAAKAQPGAARIIKVAGGYLAFDTHDEYQTWLSRNGRRAGTPAGRKDAQRS
jgi:hypothetical protein